MYRLIIALLLIVVGVVGIAGGIWGFSLQATSDVPPELLGAAQTVLHYADDAVAGADDKIAEWTGGSFTLTGLLNSVTGSNVDLMDDSSVEMFVMLHALEVLMAGIIGLETGLLMFKFRLA